MTQRNAIVKRVGDIESVLPTADVLCIAHSQNVIRGQIPNVPEIGSQRLGLLSTDAIVMHDLTRGRLPEVSEGVIGDPRFVHEQQIRNGVLARIAILKRITGT